MNILQSGIEDVLGYALDWEATGAWVNAVITGGAVFIAARLASSTTERAERLRVKSKIETLEALLSHAGWLTARAAAGAISAPAELAQIEHLEGTPFHKNVAWIHQVNSDDFMFEKLVDARRGYPDVAEFEDVLRAISDTPVLELHDKHSVAWLFQAAGAVRDVRNSIGTVGPAETDRREHLATCWRAALQIQQAVQHLQTQTEVLALAPWRLRAAGLLNVLQHRAEMSIRRLRG